MRTHLYKKINLKIYRDIDVLHIEITNREIIIYRYKDKQKELQKCELYD